MCTNDYGQQMFLSCHRFRDISAAVSNRRPILLNTRYWFRSVPTPNSCRFCHVALLSCDRLWCTPGIVSCHNCKVVFLNRYGFGRLSVPCPCNLRKVIFSSGYRIHSLLLLEKSRFLFGLSRRHHCCRFFRRESLIFFKVILFCVKPL